VRHHLAVWPLVSLVAVWALMTDMSGADKMRANLQRRATLRRGLLLARSRKRAARDFGLGMGRPVDGASDTLVPARPATGYGHNYNTEANFSRGL
jgi:hypothetical protein